MDRDKANEHESSFDITSMTSAIDTAATTRLAASLVHVPDDLEQAYQRFVHESIDQKIQTVACLEDALFRRVVFADTIMFSLDKKTGEILFARTGWIDSKIVWVHYREGGDDLPLLFTTNSMKRFLSNAWEIRFMNYLDSTIGPDNDPCGSPLEALYAAAQVGKRRIGKTRNAVGGGLNALWGFLFDREIAQLTLSYFGYTATLANYNFTVDHKDVMRDLFAESPNLTRLVGSHLHLPDILSQVKNSRSDKIISSLRSKLLNGILASQSAGHLASSSPLISSRRPIPRLTPAGWRFLANSSRAVVGISCCSRGLIDGATEVLNILGKHNIHPPYTLLAHMVRGHGYRTKYCSTEASERQYSRLIRLACEAAQRARRQGRLRRFISDEFLLVVDWFDRANADIASLALIPKNATWNSLMRQQEDWHIEILRLKAMDTQERDLLAWPSAIQHETVNGIDFQALATGKALRDEGEQMQHCVGTYIDDCMLGYSRIFSISKGHKRATLELRKNPSGGWSVAQLRGVLNGQPSKVLLEEVRKFARLYSSRSKASDSAPY